MAIIGPVESKSLKGRLTQLAITIILAVGALTMLYPFLVMISGSFRTEMDIPDMTVIPQFWVDDPTLYRKFLETTYNQQTADLKSQHMESYFQIKDAKVPHLTPARMADVEKLRTALKSGAFPHHWQVLGGIYGLRTVPENLRELRNRIAIAFHGDLGAFSKAVGTTVTTWREISFAVPNFLDRKYDYPDNWIYQTYFKMLDQSDPGERQVVSLSGRFLSSIIYPTYDENHIESFNMAHDTHLASYHDFQLPAKVPPERAAYRWYKSMPAGMVQFLNIPAQGSLRAEWLKFVNQELNVSFIVLDGVSQSSYADFQRDKLHRTGAPFTLTDGSRWLQGEEREAYEQFLHDQPPEHLRLVGPEFQLAGINVPETLAAMQYSYAMQHKGALRWTYSIRNYVTVYDELITQGRILSNTAIFCGLAVILSLLVNPLAAFALSRYRPLSTYKILLFLMATIAFPPMVTLIPQFILLRKLHLMNTFVALLIPFAADGYMIFLLKGFFDSLPQEFFEAARIDGAGEIRMFFQFTMSLSKPILAVLALGTFTGAYMIFIYALLVAPDEKMWMIGVWLYQFQQRSNSAAVYAAVLIASIPTFLIFVFTQRTIMRGIVVPSEK